MATINSINNLLRTKKTTCGWDVLVAYDREKVNKLCFSQYIQKVSTGNNFTPFNHENKQYGLLFKNIILGPPLISFENTNIANSSVIARLKFVAGEIIYTDSDGQVIRWDHISTRNEYGLKIKVDLAYSNGVVSNNRNGDISIKFNEGTLLEVEGLGDLPDELLSVFKNYLRKTAVTYNLGELVNDSSSHDLYPQEFIVRTQPHPESNNTNSSSHGNGAVLVFISTRKEGKGNYPNNDQPWIIPDGKSATMIIHDKLLFSSLLADTFNDRIANFNWETEYYAGNNSRLKFTSGYVPTTNIIRGTVTFLATTTNSRSASSYYNHRPAHLSMSDFTLRADDDGESIVGDFISAYFQDTFSYDQSAPNSYFSGMDNCNFKRSGKFKAKLTLDKDSNIVFNGGAEFKIEDHKSSASKITIGTKATTKFAEEATANLNQSNFFEIPAIKTFYIRNVLFPNENILNFDKVAIPSDLVLYGNIVESSTSLTIEPQETTVSCGNTIKFTAYSQDGSQLSPLTWSVSGVGKIDQNGVYTAPDIGAITQNKLVIINAKYKDGRSGNSIITLLISPLTLTTSFISFAQYNAPEPFLFKAILPSSNTSNRVTWSLEAEPDSNGVIPNTNGLDIGHIDNNGLYTPPQHQYPEGCYVLSILATTSGQSERALVCLKNKESIKTKMRPPFYDSVTSSSDKKLLSISDRRIDGDSWKLIPPIGSLSAVRDHDAPENIKNRVWETDYTAPTFIAKPQLVVVKASNSDARNDDFAGIGIINLLPDESAWSKVDSLSFFQIMSYQGTQEDSLYGNGLNQSTIVIKLKALSNDLEIKVPAEDIYPHLKLIDFNTGKDISLDPDWSYTVKKNEYNKQKTEGDDDSILLYVTCKSGGFNKKIAATLTLTKPGLENPEYSTGMNSNSGLDSFVYITSIQPIDYRKKDNVITFQKSSVVLVDNLSYTESSEPDKYSGECIRHDIEISPNEKYNTTFKEIEYFYSPIINESVNKQNQYWIIPQGEPSFSILENNGLKCVGVNNYSVDTVAKAQVMIMMNTGEMNKGENVYFNGNVYFENVNEKHTYRLKVNNQIFPAFTEYNGSLNFTGYEFKIPGKFAEKSGWANTLSEVRVNVVDEYGNKSSLKLRWDSGEHYILPAIS